MPFDTKNIVSKSHLVKRGKNADQTPKKWADRCGQLLTDVHGVQIVTIPAIGAWWEVEPAEATAKAAPVAPLVTAPPVAAPVAAPAAPGLATDDIPF